ncbi:allatostatin-A receptor [Drosophila biarmipes]|uniref:allatostatin-A receptor n=1 Tax=Drosophila biarmipes TaxID=125945 RepID=UPI0007E765E0|nr:allatostatin-A receptor [Drosophila biarmipes]XP_050745252.1 allatostatin-A receptor [Drosophila biarmipes]XP_050745279.1 allatostatin-A receptor [Drosophila biarmipes]XP_050745295.1 allatostatin-A receptor [Drosophila biarmipes]
MTGHRSVALLLAMLISSWPKASLAATGNGSIVNSTNSSGNNYAFTSEHSEYSDHNANDSMEYDAESVALERIVSTIVPVFFGIIGFAGLLGNGLVILVVVANQQMRSTTNLLIINLAVSDILFVIFCVPFTATDYVLPEWPFGNVWCKFVQYMIVVTCHCSVYTLVLMSFDRFLAVVHPVTSMSLRTERNATLAIMCAWITIVTTAIPVALSHSVRNYQYHGNAGTACVFSTEEEVWSLVGFQVSFFLSSYVAPLTLICFLYMGMLARLWKSAPGCKPSAESRKGKRRVTRMVVVVVLAFAICWLPIHVILVLKALNLYGGSHLSVIIQIISHVVAYTNSCINPILYAFLSDNFRKAFRKVVWCGSPPPLMTNQQVTKTTRTATGNGTSNIEML